MNNSIVRIRFEWFEPWFDKEKNFFLDRFTEEGYKIVVIEDKKSEVDIEFIGVYPPLKRDIQARIHRWRTRLPVWQRDTTETYPLEFGPETKNSKKRVWITFENIRPPFQDDLDLTFSYDQDSLGGRNFYLPLWQIHLEHQRKFGKPLNPNSSLGHEILSETLVNSRAINLERFRNRKFACAFLANPQPTRLRLIEELSKFGTVDVFGAKSGRPVPNKYEVAKEYNFFICPENDLYPGYVTEKLLDAYMCETVPIYWGDLGSDQHINRKSFLNLRDFDSINNFSEHIAKLDFDDYNAIYEQPFLIKRVDFNLINKKLVSMIK